MKRFAVLLCLAMSAFCPAKDKPLMKDFMGICVHTVQFKPDLYRPVCRQVRDYHGLNWDLGEDTDFWPTFPLARNQVDWQSMYGTWVNAGYEIDASINLGPLPYDQWKNPGRDAETYGFAFARFFGPSSRNLVTAVEIGNEPGHLDDRQYRTIFQNMAKGLRAGDPKMKVVTCAAINGKSHQYAKSLECVKGLEDVYDVINVHSYAQVKGWPTWQRSYPEDASIVYLKDIQDAIDWRDQNAHGKEVWLTEFGWDSTTKPNPIDGDFKDWMGNTDSEQARFLVRSWLIFSAMDLDRAYMFWFNDTDLPQVHGASGLTRNYLPKPSFWAVSHLQATLGEYRFEKVLRKTNDVYVYAYAHETNPNKRVYVAWCPVAAENKASVSIELGNAKVTAAEQMPLKDGPAPKASYRTETKEIIIDCSEVPVYIHVEMINPQ